MKDILNTLNEAGIMKNQDALNAWNEQGILLCDRCAAALPGDVESHGDIEWAGQPIAPLEYVKRAKKNPNVWIVCDRCITAMPDADLAFDESGREVEFDKTDKGIVCM